MNPTHIPAFTHRPCIAVMLLLSAAWCSAKPVVDYVNPMIGTAEHGHVYPGATVPFGMMQLSPDTRDNTWDGSSGYHYSDGSILHISKRVRQDSTGFHQIPWKI